MVCFWILDMKLHYGDLTDSTCLVKIINEVKPTEIYNLGAQSHVKVSHFYRQTSLAVFLSCSVFYFFLFLLLLLLLLFPNAGTTPSLQV